MSSSLFKYTSTDSKHGIFPCTHSGCNGVFNTKFSWKRHQLVHREEKKFECQWCRKLFASNQQLKEHSYSHTKERPYICRIDGCTKNFRHASELSLHRRTHPGYKLRKYHYLRRKSEVTDNKSPLKKFIVVYAKESKNIIPPKEEPKIFQTETSTINKNKTDGSSDSIGEIHGLDMNYLEYLSTITTFKDKRPVLPLPEYN